MASQTPHEIVIVGGNFGGVNLVHYLFRQTLPALAKVYPQFSYHVTLVSPNSHFYYKISVPRTLVNTKQIPEEKLFYSITEAFKQYGADKFDFIQGKVVAVKAGDKTVTVQPNGDAQPRDVKYDSLVIATGTTSTSPLWTLHDDHEKSRTAIKALHEALPKASTVLVAGGGPVGIETAGEIATTYPKAKVTLVAGERLLPKHKLNLGVKAKKALEDVGVTVRLNAKLVDATADAETRPVKLSDESSETPDVFINATGPRINNTEWLPEAWLDAEKRVVTRDSYFRIKGDGTDNNIYVVGDVVSGTNKTAIEVDAMVVTAASSIAVDIAKGLGDGKPPTSGSLLSSLNPFAKAPAIAQKEYKPMKDTIVVPVGPNGGVGIFSGFTTPAFLVKKVKAEKFLFELAEPLTNGKKWA